MNYMTSPAAVAAIAAMNLTPADPFDGPHAFTYGAIGDIYLPARAMERGRTHFANVPGVRLHEYTAITPAAATNIRRGYQGASS